MIVVDAGASRFQVRVAGLIWSHGHLLVHRGATDDFWTLPGGRLEMHESSAETLLREISEELGRTAKVGALRVVIENFFEYEGRLNHELGLFHDLELDEPLPFHPSEVVHSCIDGSTTLEFRWARPDDLVSFDLKPAPLINLLKALPEGIAHAVNREIP